jgi:4'-phosphopantetheinyl transferase
MTPDLGEETVLRRLTILLAMKQAYIRAIGQPLGFDWSRLEFDVPARTARGDNLPLTGWEFRVFNAKLGVLRGPHSRIGNLSTNTSAAPSPAAGAGAQPGEQKIVEETYVCCVAFFRGTRDSKFDFHDSMEQLESWVQFINIDQMLKVVPKLTA